MPTTRRRTIPNSQVRLPRHHTLLPSNLRQVRTLMAIRSLNRVTRTRRIRRHRVLLTVATIYNQISRRNLTQTSIINPRRITTPRIAIRSYQLILHHAPRGIKRHISSTIHRIRINLNRLSTARTRFSRQSRPPLHRVNSQIVPHTNHRQRQVLRQPRVTNTIVSNQDQTRIIHPHIVRPHRNHTRVINHLNHKKTKKCTFSIRGVLTPFMSIRRTKSTLHLHLTRPLRTTTLTLRGTLQHPRP